MRTIYYPMLVAVVAISAHAQVPANLPALPARPPWAAVVNVTDESGQPVAGANVDVWYYIKPPSGQSEASEKINGLTDTNGVFRASHQDTGSWGLSFRVTKPGYYTTTHGQQLYVPGQFDDQTVLGSRNAQLTLVLKKIGQPLAMYAKKEEAKMPKENEPVGFDLMAGDWVAPFGKGTTADFLFTVHRRIANQHQYDAELKLTFPNKGDGIAIGPSEPDTGSELKTPRTVTVNEFMPERVWHYSDTNQPESVAGYFIRVRTVLDESGQVKSALYGKIQGDIRLFVGTIAPRAGIGFAYYLNPNPNDFNVEFNPKQDLIGRLEPDEEIKEP